MCPLQEIGFGRRYCALQGRGGWRGRGVIMIASMPTTTELGPERQRVIDGVRSTAPDKVSVFLKAYQSRSLKAAIRARCLVCRKLQVANIRDCENTACTLHNVRPYVTPENANAQRAKAEVNHGQTT